MLARKSMRVGEGMAMKRGVGVGAAVVAAVVMAAVPAMAQDKPVELKFSYWVPPAHPLIPASQAWADDIAKESNGTIKITIFPSEQLGKAFDHYDMARDGIADITYVSPGYQPGRFPIIDAAALPFVIKNATGGSRAVDEWYMKYAPVEMKDVHICGAYVHDPGALHMVKKKVLLPEDLKGMKIRPAHATIAAFVTSLGGTNVQASAPEARDVLERGVADGITFPWGSIFLFHMESVLKYHMDLPFYTTPFVTAMNKAKYDGLSANQKKVIDDHCTADWAERLSAPWAEFEAAGRVKMKTLPGHDVYTLDAVQLAAWKKALEPLRARWADNVRKVGVDPDQVMAELEADLKKDDAAY
jgi:TRAP-type C4-dicarboxylate transport system substrate-binding protein